MTAASFAATFVGALVEASAGLAALALVGCLVWGGAWWQARRQSGAESKSVAVPVGYPPKDAPKMKTETGEYG